MRSKIWLILLFLLGNSSLLFSQYYRVGDVITNPDNTKGVVFYINPEGTNGWMVALNDATSSSGCIWGGNGHIQDLPANVTNASINLLNQLNGEAYTQAILKAGSGYPAASNAANWGEGWYLPDIGQLRILVSKIALIEGPLTDNDGSTLSANYYWSSLESGSNNAWAVCLANPTGNATSLNNNPFSGSVCAIPRNQSCAVRAVRSFTIPRYQWKENGQLIAGASYDTLTVSPTQTTTYTVEVMGSGICYATDDITITVNPETHNSITETACESYTWTSGNGQTYTTSGTYFYPYENEEGCSSTDTLHLTISNAALHDEYVTECESFTWVNGETYTSSVEGITYTYPGGSVHGCDSIVTLYLTINHGTHNSITETACESYTWTSGNGQTYTTSGTYIYPYENEEGCASTDTLHLTISNAALHDEYVTECESFTWVNGETYTSSVEGITYTYPGGSVHGCDSIVTLYLTINHGTHNSITETACESYTWTSGDGQTYTESGTYMYPYENEEGCASTDTLHLTISNAALHDEYVTECESFTWVNGETYTSSVEGITYTYPGGSVHGCDSIVTLYLTINHGTHNSITETACESFEWHGNILTQSDTYVHEYTNENGCPSADTLHLTINHGTHNSITETACESYEWHGNILTQSDTYVHEYTNENGCPSADTLHLTINHGTHNSITETACESYEWHGNILTQSDTYVHEYTNENGCLSADTLHLTINHGTHNSITETACESFEWHGNILTQSDTYVHEYTNENGCPSADTLHLTISESAQHDQYETSCEEFTWINGMTYTSSVDGVTYTYYGGSQLGCDSIVTLHLTINHGTHDVTTETACESYTWHGTEYTSTGVYWYNYTNSDGCPSADTLHLTINHGTHNVTTETTCESYTWHGTEYATTGVYWYNYTNGDGCPSADTLHLTINHGTHNVTTETACESYTWHGTEYATTGVYWYNYTNSDGCPSADTLHLTINHGTHNVTTETACENYTWHGTEYATTGVYWYNYTNSDGCPSADTLHLTINHGTHNVTTETACENYTWHGTEYTSTGVYWYDYTNGDGCPSADTLRLTIEPVLQGDTIVVVGIPFEWYGQTYPESGDYPHTFEDGSYLGCDSTVMLHLTVLPVIPGDTTVITCEPFEWYGATYSVSGDYPHIIENGSYLNCDSTVVLHLTVLPVIPGDTTVITCGSFEWYGETYPESGDYPHVFENASYLGCDSIVTLHLAIEPVLQGDTAMLTCEPFEWYGEIHSESGDYSHVFENASYLGCDSIVTLHLTIEPVLQGDTIVVVGVPFEWYGQTYPESGDYPHTFEEGSYLGCDSTVMLHLTVLPSLPGDTTVVTCEPFEWYGATYSVSGDYPHIIENGSYLNCDSTVVLHLTVLPVIPGDTTVITCEAFEWYDETYPESGDYTHVFEDASYLGCDSTVMLHLTVLPVLPGDTMVITCEPFEWYGETYPVSGDYPHIIENGSYLNCDSTVVLHLTVLPVIPGDTTVITCEPFEWYGETYPESGDYTHVLENASYLGCDSIVTLHLTIEPVLQGDTTVVVGVPFEWYGETYPESGDYPHTFEDGSYLGCDSTVMLHLTVLPSLPGDTTVVTCEPFEWYGETYPESGDYPHVFEGGGYLGNDSTLVLHLTVIPVLPSDTIVLTCEPFEWYDDTYSESGDFTHVFEDASYLGCDSIVTLHLTIEPVLQGDTTVVVGVPFEWYGDTYPESGDYPHTFENASYLGCDSTVMLHLTVLPSLPGDTTVVTCEPFEWYGETYPETGDYPHTIEGGSCTGNDSIVVLHLTVIPVLPSDTTMLTCEPFEWYGETYPESGDFTHVFENASSLGCDSIVTLHLTIEPVLQGDTTVVVGVPFEWYGDTYPESGDYPHTFENASYLGCDSTVMLHLTVLPSLPGDTTVVTCEPFEWYGDTYPETGDYPHTIEGGSCTGNDSIVVLHLTVIPVLPGDTTMLTCEPFEWYGETYPESGDYTHVLENASYLGCDSIVTLHLTIEPVLQGDTTVVVGVPFEWYGQTYPESGDYPHTFEDGSYLGCDSTVMLHLTVLPSLPGDTTVVTCEPFEWYGETYPETGDYPHTIEGGSCTGNDSIVVLHLTVIPVLPGDTTMLTCEPFEWYGETYPESGDYTHVLENASYLGCDSIVTLHLTIEPVLQGDTTVVVGVPFEWYGQTYPESGDYPHTFEDGSYLGCDSTVMLHLTVLPSLPGDTTVVTCEPFEWYGETYSESGDYPHVFEGGGYLGNDSTLVLHLMIIPVLPGDTTMLTCESFEWYGEEYEVSGEYTHVFENASYLGCDSIVTLHLTIEPVLQGDTLAIACESFEWYGEDYDTSGDYTHVFEDGSYLGCDSIVTLHLTINHGTHETFWISECEYFNWHGFTCYTTGVYTYEYDNDLGCPSVDTLYLTIEEPYYDTIAMTACEYYGWYGHTYTDDGFYDHVIPGPVCDSTIVLNLTVVNEFDETITITACDDYEWLDSIYYESGYYTDTLVSQHGCDSIIRLDLTIINPDIHILGYSDVYYASDLWHGIYNYYVVDSTDVDLGPIEWECTDPDWLIMQVSNFHCILVVRTMGTATLTAHATTLSGCDDLLSMDISSTEFTKEDEVTEVLMFPNPALTEVTIQAPNLTNLQIINTMGQVVKTIKPDHNDETTVGLLDLSVGVYVVEITTSDGIFMERLIISR